MNKLLEHFETGAFNELISFPFEEVRGAFNFYDCFVSDEDGAPFINEATEAKKWYQEELDKIEKYAQNEYANNLNAGVYIPEWDEPNQKIKDLEIQAKRKLIRIIKKFFNRDTFDLYKQYMYGHPLLKEEAVETPHELLIALNRYKSRIYTLLSILGYYQRHYGYFFSKATYFSICSTYSREVFQVNKSLGMYYKYRNIFLASGRIKPPKNQDENLTDEELEDSKHYQNSKFVDIDKISLFMLIRPYLNYNTREICKILEIMEKNYRITNNGEKAWENIQREVKEFIDDCEKKGIMRKFD